MAAPGIAHEDIERVLRPIIPRIQQHLSRSPAEQKCPFILALTGLQGSGKSTWTDALVKALHRQHHYTAINISLDDLYLDHDELVALRELNPSNKLLRTRGQPGTHDTRLAVSFFQSLSDPSQDTRIPSFDKSKFRGEGGRAPQESWRCIPAGTTVDVVVFEGWCLGFQPLADEEIGVRWDGSRAAETGSSSRYPTETLRSHAVEHLRGVNGDLRRYGDLFMGPRHFDFLVHLDTDDLGNVYEWRMQQERALRLRGNGAMSDGEVVRFVEGYMPAYELYLDQLRRGFFRGDRAGSGEKGQLRVVLDKGRKIVDVSSI